MPVSVTMPRLGESVSEGTITRWLKEEGEQVKADEPLLEVSTDKVDTEIPAPASGVLLSIKAHEDETVEVGAEIAVIGEPAEAGGESAPEQPAEGRDASGQAAAADADSQRAQQAPDQVQDTAREPARDAGAEAPSSPAQEGPAGGGEGDQAGASGQAVSVTLPALGESVTEGTITRWLKQEGEQVKADEPLVEVSTDKVDTEIPAPASGVLQSIKVHEDETVGVGTELAVIGSAGAAEARSAPAPAAADADADAATVRAPSAPAEQRSQEPPREEREERPMVSEAPAPAPAPPPPRPAEPAPQPTPQGAGQAPQDTSAVHDRAESGDGSAYVTPLVRKLAAEHSVDLSSLTGTGVGGRIRKQDVLEAAKQQQAQRQTAPAPEQPEPAAEPAAPAAQAAPSPLRGRTEKMSRLRKVIAERMVESLQVSAQLSTVVEVDVTNIARLRERAKRDFEAREGVKLTFLPFFAKAVVEALKQYPSLNASIDTDKGEITYHAAEHLGIAVDTERGLLVPVIRDAGDLNIAGLARKIADLAERTRSNRVGPDELGGGTFTLTNTGSRGALFDTPIINQPQVGILGTGAVVKRPVVVAHRDLGETIAFRSMMYLVLTYDHRLVDGADAARFLSGVKKRLEEGDFAADLGI
jgi:2-oxoglutarate dehydrogenase E2 component (dihydrolipoamide succinyltransferase)